MTDTEMKKIIADFLRNPPIFAIANKRGNFPAAQAKPSSDGKSLDLLPLAYACTDEGFEKIRGLCGALKEWLIRQEKTP